jgi:hypothetical protein
VHNLVTKGDLLLVCRSEVVVSVFKRDNEFLPKCLMCWWKVIGHGESKSETDKLSCYDNDGIKI